MVGVCVHRLYPLAYIALGIRKIDAVAQRLAHLRLAIGTGQTETGRIVRQEYLRLNECIAISVVEPSHYLTRLFNHRLLIFSCGYGSGIESGYIRCLTYGVCEEADRNVGLEVTHLDFGLYRRVALET